MNECKNATKHAKQPYNYHEWQAWAKKINKTHEQTKCKGCGLWIVWVKKKGK